MIDQFETGDHGNKRSGLYTRGNDASEMIPPDRTRCDPPGEIANDPERPERPGRPRTNARIDADVRANRNLKGGES